MSEIERNIAIVRERIAAAATRAGRNPEEVTLVAVTKGVGIDRVLEAIASGVTHIGENRVQEAAVKFPHLPPGIVRHMVGHLQRNKAKLALRLFDLIHSVDSLRLAEELNRRAMDAGVTMDVLIQVNVSGEPTKYGISPEEVEALVENMTSFPGLRLRGLMTIAPLGEHAEQARPYFRRLRELGERLRNKVRLEKLELSMGMTDDFEVAVEEGATIVRIGRAIFGPRE
ncbi:MAG: YggS family pyridoxal phosphate-dependent enzyme [Armatimonadota bacterium]|nr:YggS family pyridoxal phosphate-dependent enzyme [Armatimonadota bacterium]MDR7434938.1 YggS family pyridoxal phosphate-dependent enzyme [Armatimonadota bacterium]